MAKRSRSVSTPVARAPFHRGAYVEQYIQSKAADAWVTANDPDGGPLPALIGSPELGGRRGSNRSEITPAFTYYAVFGEVDPDGPTITLASGATMLVEEYEALVAEPDIDSVTQHATTAHRDRRLMSAASITRTRYVGPCVERADDQGEKVWQRASTSKAGVLTWHDCPTACPQGCKAEHRHVRHQHRDAGTLYVHQTMPYGDDGLERGTTTTTIIGRLWGPGSAECPREGTAREVTRPLSKRQGRRTRRASMGAWPDAPSYAYDPDRTTAVDVVSLPVAVPSDGHNATRGDGLAMVPETYTVERETLAEAWARVPFVPAKVPGANGRPPSTLAVGMPEATLRHRIAADPASAQLAYRVLLAAEHAWASNGQPITAEQGLTLLVLPAHGGPTLTITRDGETVAAGTYKARRSLVRLAVASVLTS